METENTAKRFSLRAVFAAFIVIGVIAAGARGGVFRVVLTSLPVAVLMWRVLARGSFNALWQPVADEAFNKLTIVLLFVHMISGVLLWLSCGQPFNAAAYEVLWGGALWSFIISTRFRSAKAL